MKVASSLNPEISAKIAGKGLVLYDGDCGFCQFWVQFILKRDRSAHFLFAPLQAPWAMPLHRRSNPGAEFETIMLYENGIIFERSEAVLRIFSRLWGPWKIAKVFLLLPSGLLDTLYDAIASRRHKLLPLNACRFPAPQERERFLS